MTVKPTQRDRARCPDGRLHDWRTIASEPPGRVLACACGATATYTVERLPSGQHFGAWRITLAGEGASGGNGGKSSYRTAVRAHAGLPDNGRD